MDTVVFKKRAKKNSSATTTRKRTRGDDEERPIGQSDERVVEENAAEEATLQTIEELLEDQKLRTELARTDQQQRRKAKRSATSTSTSGTSAEATTSATNDAQYGLHDPKKDGAAGQKLLNLLDGQFTGQSGVTQRDQYEELANKYIEERLQKRATSDANDATAPPTLTDEDALYADLRREVGGPKAASESTDGSVLVWNTGIAEVELPSKYHEKTVRETMQALERERAGSHTKIHSSALPTNFSTDFNRHRSEYIAELKALPREEQRDIGFVGAPKKHKPSDDQAVSRFRKLESRRRHN